MFRDAAIASTEDFLRDCRDYLAGDVLDFGCGAQPYRQIIEDAGGTYHPYDRDQFPGNKTHVDVGWSAESPRLRHYDAAVCTDVIQYLPSPSALLVDLHALLSPRGYLIVTGPTNWPADDSDDLIRYTPLGAKQLLIEAGYRILRMVSRGEIIFESEEWSIGWAALAEPL